MKTKKAAATAKSKKTTAKAQPLPVVKFKESTLQLMGFGGRGETICHETNKGLARIGKLLHKRGLIPHAEDWWQRVPVVDAVRFHCAGRDYEVRVHGYMPQESRWRVSFIQGPTEVEEWMEKRSEGHPERTRWAEVPLSKSEAEFCMKEGKRLGFDNFEDFLTHVLEERFRQDKWARKLGAAIGEKVVEKLSEKGALAK